MAPQHAICNPILVPQAFTVTRQTGSMERLCFTCLKGVDGSAVGGLGEMAEGWEV